MHSALQQDLTNTIKDSKLRQHAGTQSDCLYVCMYLMQLLELVVSLR